MTLIFTVEAGVIALQLAVQGCNFCCDLGSFDTKLQMSTQRLRAHMCGCHNLRADTCHDVQCLTCTPNEVQPLEVVL